MSLSKTLSAYPAVFHSGKEDVAEGGKVLLPASLLQELSRVHAVYPLQFHIQTRRRRECFCGVLAFTAREGEIVLPNWVNQHLLIEPGDPILLHNVSLPKAYLVKLRPQEKAFIDLSNPKVVLERSLQQGFTVLSAGTTITVRHCDRDFAIDILETRGPNGPERAVLVIDADVKVEFERPLDMPPSPVGPAPSAAFPVAGGANVIGSDIQFAPVAFTPPTLTGPGASPQAPPEPPKEPAFVPFQGQGRTLSGRPPPTNPGAKQPASAPPNAAASAAATQAPGSAQPAKGPNGFVPFAGQGRSFK